jgi:hypothetical protein
MRKPSDNKDNYVEVNSLDDIKQEARLEVIADMIIAGKSRPAIINELSAQWNTSKNTMQTIYNEAVIRLQQDVNMSKEQVRAISNARLENVWESAVTVNQKLKTIDLINKTNNVYETDVNVNAGDNTFKFEIGVETPDTELSYDESQEIEAEKNN